MSEILRIIIFKLVIILWAKEEIFIYFFKILANPPLKEIKVIN